MSATRRQRGRTGDAAMVIFAVTGGAWAWTLQLWLSWVVGEPLCFLQVPEIGQDGVRVLWLVVGLATALLALGALLVSFRLWRRSAGRSLMEEPAENGPRRFLAYVGLVLNGLFLLAILMGSTSPLWLQPCA